MSRLHELAVDLGIEVDKFASRIEEEKRRISEAKARLDRQLKQRLNTEEETSALEADLERLQKNLFVSAPTAATTLCGPYLMKALGEVRAAAQRMRDERMEILTEYKTKLDQCEVLCRRNAMLEAFIDNWRKSLAEGKNVSELPEPVKKLSEEVARFYSTPVHQLLEEALAQVPNTAGDSIMEVSVVNALASEAMLTSSVPPASMKPPTTTAASLGLVDEAICNATTVETSMCRVRGGPEPSILLGEGGAGEFSRLDCLDATLTDRQGVCSEEALRKLMQLRNDTTVDQDQTLYANGGTRGDTVPSLNSSPSSNEFKSGGVVCGWFLRDTYLCQLHFLPHCPHTREVLLLAVSGLRSSSADVAWIIYRYGYGFEGSLVFTWTTSAAYSVSSLPQMYMYLWIAKLKGLDH
ncbi:hypothetical protein TcWFU_003036 [Taenia crassiceps]|uniref:Uncharacterized protein n=1 Tax=Taenia crassiceps TaxID=6207 RepID=A0ABR4Q1X2_9CEST